MTVPSAWLTEEDREARKILERIASDWGTREVQTNISIGYVMDLQDRLATALSHQAALETATDLPLGEVIAAWRAVKKCTDEFLPEYPGACEEYKSVLHEQLNALEAKR